MHVYLFSGLGADASAFQDLLLPPPYECVHIHYIAPEKKETISAYALRLTAQIDQQKPYALIGLSFGGILVMELLDFLKPAKTIIISSITNKYEIPVLYRIAGWLRLHNALPSKRMNRPNRFTFWLFGVHTNNDKSILAAILNRTDGKFTKWAIHEILHWKRQKVQPGVWRIHGTKDKLLPVNKAKVDFAIDNAGHLLIVQHGKEVSKIVTELLNK